MNATERKRRKARKRRRKEHRRRTWKIREAKLRGQLMRAENEIAWLRARIEELTICA